MPEGFSCHLRLHLSNLDFSEQNFDLCVKKMYKNTVSRVYCMNIVHNRFKAEKNPHISRNFAHLSHI